MSKNDLISWAILVGGGALLFLLIFLIGKAWYDCGFTTAIALGNRLGMYWLFGGCS